MNTLKQNEENDIVTTLENLKERFNSNSIQDILEDHNIWEELVIIIEQIVNFMIRYKYFNSLWIVQHLLFFLQIIVEKEEFFDKVVNTPFKTIFSKITLEHREIPPWFIEITFKFITKYVNISDLTSRVLLKMIWKSRTFNNQKAFTKILRTCFNPDRMYNDLSSFNQELQRLFGNIFSSTNVDGAIRIFLNKLNSEEHPPKIISVKADVKLTELIIIDCWIDFNISAKVITFECLRNHLISKKSKLNFNKEYEHDTVIINMKSISNLRFKGAKINDSADELVLELTEPCKAYFETSLKFLENCETVIFYVHQNKTLFHEILNTLWYRKEEEIPTSSLPDSFEINLLQDDETGVDETPISNTLLAESEHIGSRKENNYDEDIVNETQIDKSMGTQEHSSEENYISEILKTPNRADLKIVVSDSQSSCDESALGDAEITAANLDSSVLMTPPLRSGNVSVAETYTSPVSILSTQESNKSIKNEPVFYSEMIDLVTPESNSPPTINENAEEMCNEADFHLALSEREIETVTIEESQAIVSGNNVRSKPLTTISMDTSGQAQETSIGDAQKTRIGEDQSEDSANQILSQSSNESKKNRKRRKYDEKYDPTYNPHMGSSPTVRKYRKITSRRKSAEIFEFGNESFFSDAETSADYTYTRTRIIKKLQPFQVKYQSDSEVRAPRRKNRPETHEQPPVKKIKTLLPVRRSSENTPTASQTEPTTERNTVDAFRKSRNHRRLHNIHNVDHLELLNEEPTSPAVCRLPVPDASKLPQLIPESPKQQNTTLRSPDKSSPKKNLPSKTSPNKTSPKKIVAKKISPKQTLLKKSSPKKSSAKNNSPKNPRNQDSRSPKKQYCSQENEIENYQEIDDLDTSRKIRNDYDQFDRIKYDIPSTQNTKLNRNLHFFSSSSNSPEFGNNLKYKNSEDYFQQPEPSRLEKTSPKTNKNEENCSPKAANKKDKMSVTDYKKIKRSPVKKSHLKIVSPRKAKQPKDNDKIFIENESRTQLSTPLRNLTNTETQAKRCELCGAPRYNIKEMQKAILKICDLNLNSLYGDDRSKFCKKMERFFKKKREEE